MPSSQHPVPPSAQRTVLIALLLTVTLASSARAIQTAGGVYSVSFANGLPEKWEKGVPVRSGLPSGSQGGVAAASGDDIQCNPAWVSGHFAVADGMYFNYRAKLTRPEWYQLFVFCKARGDAATDMNLYEAKPPADPAAAGRWHVVSIPLSDFRGTSGPNTGKAPRAGEVCWTYFWSFQKRDLGMVVDRIWVTRGKPADVPAGPLPEAEQNRAPVKEWPVADSWAFDPPEDTFSPESLLDLRYLNEQVAGESGFVRLSPDGSDLVLGSGKPARFWAVNTGLHNRLPDRPADLAKHARFLAKRGVNMARFHGNVTPGSGNLSSIDIAERDRLWRLVAAMKTEGIYVTASIYWAASSRVKPAMGTLDTGGEVGNHGLLFIDARLQAAYKAWWRAVLAEPNPYTGIPLAKDPALAILQLQNEDSLFFWTTQGIKGTAAEELRRRFGAFVKSKYGTIEAALQAYGDGKAPDDNPSRGEVGLFIVWELTQDRGSDGWKRRCADQTEFMARTMRTFHADMARFFRDELGARQLVNAGNWKTADDVKLLDANRWADAANEVLATNRYITGVHEGQHNGWAIVNGDRFTDPSVLTSPRDLAISLKQVARHPMMVTESTWVPPMGYQSEGPFLIAAYQSLTGVDAYYWFATGEEQWRKPGSANGYLPSEGKWVCATPMVMGQWPAAALLYRAGYVRRADPIVVEQRSLEDLWRRRTPLLAEDPGFDPNRDRGSVSPKSNLKDGIDPMAFLVGPVVVEYDADPAGSRVAALAPYIDTPSRTVRASTGEMVWDYGTGVCTLDCPRAQGVAGFLRKKGTTQLRDLQVASSNDYATVLAISMDGKPLAQSARVLVQVGTVQRPTNWKTRAAELVVNSKPVAGEEVVDFGTAPWRIRKADVTLTLGNPGLKRMRVLDANGMAVRDEPIRQAGGKAALKLPADALYVVLDQG